MQTGEQFLISEVIADGIKFIVPDEVTLRQYKNAKKLIDQVMKGSPILENDKKNEVTMDFSKVLTELLNENRIGEFLSILLVPEKAVWKEENINLYKNSFEDLGDKTVVGIVTNFLSGRTDLIMYIVSFLQNFLKESEPLLSKAKESEQ